MSMSNNITKLKNLNQPVAKVKAVNSGPGARNASLEVTNGLEPVLYLSIGARIMLIFNLWANQGLVNGAMGTIIDIIYELGRSPPSLPTVILLKMDNYKGPTLSISNYNQVVPIRPIKYTWEGQSGICSRKQFPLCLARAITI